MGFNFSIGEAKFSEDSSRVYVECVTLPEAPAFGEPTDYTNERWPSYSSWERVTRTLGINEMFFGYMFEARPGVDELALIPEHPGYAPISELHLEFLKARVDEYRDCHPGKKAGYAPVEDTHDYQDDPILDEHLVRAEWLLFWFDWALKNCENPVFVNS